MATVVAANAAQLPPAIVTLCAGLLTTWNTLNNESDIASADKTISEHEKRSARLALQHELHLTLAKLIELFTRQPEKLPLYMQQHLLEDHPTEEEEEEPEPDPEE